MPEQLHSLPCAISSPVFEKTVEGTGVYPRSFSSSSADRTGESPLLWLCQFLSLVDQLVYRSWNSEYKDKLFYPGLSQELCYIYWFHTIKEERKIHDHLLDISYKCVRSAIVWGLSQRSHTVFSAALQWSPIKPRRTSFLKKWILFYFRFLLLMWARLLPEQLHSPPCGISSPVFEKTIQHTPCSWHVGAPEGCLALTQLCFVLT